MNIWRFEGQDVTIPCRYNSHYHGTCDVCWMRGSIPRSGCGNQIIYASGKNVLMRGNRRYQLNGNLQKGDASLTILNARISDSGKYGCRIHVPGWFNDIKVEVYLIIMEGKYSFHNHRNTAFLHVSYFVLCFIVTLFFSTKTLHHSEAYNHYDTRSYTR